MKIITFLYLFFHGLILITASCAFYKQTQEVDEVIPSVFPTNTMPPPTDTHATQKIIQAASLYQTDFENGYPLEIYADFGDWEIRNESDGNKIFCSSQSEDWNSFTFGLEAWENYRISLRMKFHLEAEGQIGEVYLRVNSEMGGYRASVTSDQWAYLGYYPPYRDLGGKEISLGEGEWFQIQAEVVENDLKYWVNNQLVAKASDEGRFRGLAGIGAGPNTEICLDDIQVWGLDQDGNPLLDTSDLALNPADEPVYTIQDKIQNKPTLPVFYPWSGNCESDSRFYFDCDSPETPYSLVWIASGIAQDIESTQPEVSKSQTRFMASDPDTLYLISEEWHYYNLSWRTLSEESKFYLDEIYGFHVNSEYGATKVINFEHPGWSALLAQKAVNFKDAGFDGLMLDWWHDGAGNGRSRERVLAARLAIIQTLREAVGDDFILLGNVNWEVSDPTAPYLSGVFLELWKPDPGKGYALYYADENQAGWNPSIERMEDLLLYWDANLAWPKVIAFEPWKITKDDYIADRYTDENYRYAKLFAAMGVVIPENGYFLYADNNDDWDGGDHQHAFYYFYHTDFGQATSGRIEVQEGVAYKEFQGGIIAYNRTETGVAVELSDGRVFSVGPLEGAFLEKE